MPRNPARATTARPRTPGTRTPMTLEVVERHVFTITDREIAAAIRQALQCDDFERLDELITGLHVDGCPDTNTLECREVTQ